MILGYRLRATGTFVDWHDFNWRSKTDLATSTPVPTQSHQEKMDVTKMIVDDYIHIEFERLTRQEIGPVEKNLVEKGRKMVKNGETGSEITKAHAWTPCEPNIVSLTAPVLTLHIMAVHEGIPKANRGVWVEKWTVIGGRKC